jgi:hypothetical protein
VGIAAVETLALGSAGKDFTLHVQATGLSRIDTRLSGRLLRDEALDNTHQ